MVVGCIDFLLFHIWFDLFIKTVARAFVFHIGLLRSACSSTTHLCEHVSSFWLTLTMALKILFVGKQDGEFIFVRSLSKTRSLTSRIVLYNYTLLRPWTRAIALLSFSCSTINKFVMFTSSSQSVYLVAKLSSSLSINNIIKTSFSRSIAHRTSLNPISW